MIETIPTPSPKTIGFKLSGKLHDEDYSSFVPTVESFLAAEGKARLFVQFEDFHGWDLHAVWDDTKFAFKHYSDFDRIAIVGERRWEKWMAYVCKPFTKATVRYFDASQIDDAWAWLREGAETSSTA
jgi:SpoIIAA-like